jgi:hypothetical protein
LFPEFVTHTSVPSVVIALGRAKPFVNILILLGAETVFVVTFTATPLEYEVTFRVNTA